MLSTPTTSGRKRPRELGSGSTQPAARKEPRADVDSLLATLDETVAQLAKIGGATLTVAQAELVNSYAFKMMRVKGEHGKERDRVRGRPVDETMLLATADLNPDGTKVFRSVSLPAEMLVMMLRSLRPHELASVAGVNRAWHAAVRDIARERSQAFGESTLTLAKLDTIDKQMQRAPALLTSLSFQSYSVLRDFEKSVIGQFVPLLESYALRDLAKKRDYAWRLLSSMLKPTAQQWATEHADDVVAEVSAGTSTQSSALRMICERPGVLLPPFKHRLGDVAPPVLAGQDRLATRSLLSVLYLLPAEALASIPDLATLLAPLLDGPDADDKLSYGYDLTRGQAVRSLLRRIPTAA